MANSVAKCIFVLMKIFSSLYSAAVRVMLGRLVPASSAIECDYDENPEKELDETLILNLHKPQTFVVFDRHNAIKCD